MVEQGNAKLSAIRAEMASRDLECFVCFHMDAHNSEYIAPCDERIAYISGFDGSNGIVVVTKDDARMWTDGRYYLSAEKQLEEGWKMMKWEATEQTWFAFVDAQVEKGQKVGIDFTQYPAKSMKTRTEFFKKKDIEVVSVPNLVDLVWGAERPVRSEGKVQLLAKEYTGQDTLDKYETVAKKLDGSVDALLVTTLDDIAWLLNLRGNDIEYNPVFFSYLIFYPGKEDKKHSVTLYISAGKVSDLKDYLESVNVTVVPYEQIAEDLVNFAESDLKIGADVDQLNAELHRHIKDVIVEKSSIVETIKAAKNTTEQAGMRACNVRDCAAIMKYFAFLEEELKKPDHGLDEYSGAMKMNHLRSLDPLNRGPSFESISSIGANAAIIHYAPPKEGAEKLNNDEIYLLDSGGQYLDGTTDITRTAHFSGSKAPTAFQKEAYTRVLLGVLDLERIVWPSTSAISGADMDILARRHLWAVGLDFKHGTGHGVGSYLNVHEGPQNISRYNKVKLVEGHCVSDEPGYYKDGEFGIRIENVIMV